MDLSILAPVGAVVALLFAFFLSRRVMKADEGTDLMKKIAAAVYLYQVDNDGEWGEISFDFEAGTAEIIRLAEWDTTISKVFATKVVALVMKDGDYQTKESILAVSC